MPLTREQLCRALEVLAEMAEYDYSVRPLKKGGPAQEVRDLGPKLTPREPTPEGKKKKKKRTKEYMKKNPGFIDKTEYHCVHMLRCVTYRRTLHIYIYYIKPTRQHFHGG